MRLRQLIPFLGWSVLSDDEARELSIPIYDGVQWMGLTLEWFGRGVLLSYKGVRRP